MKKRNIIIYLSKHWIKVWIVLSLSYALIIQVLFSFPATNRFMEAHWEAGDILTYASTVSLGLLALWQNRKIQDENDAAQEKLKEIIVRSNELNIISKIIEHEEKRLYELQMLMDTFLQNCDPQAMGIALEEDKRNDNYVSLTVLEREIDDEFFKISRYLVQDLKLKYNDKLPIKKLFCKTYLFTKETIKKIEEGSIDTNDKEKMQSIAKELSRNRDLFMTEKEKYLGEMQKKLNKLLFENLSLEEIHKIYT